MAPLCILSYLRGMLYKAGGCGIRVDIFVDIFHFALNFDRLDEGLAVTVERGLSASVQIKRVDNSAFNAFGNAAPEGVGIMIAGMEVELLAPPLQMGINVGMYLGMDRVFSTLVLDSIISIRVGVRSCSFLNEFGNSVVKIGRRLVSV